MMDLVKTIFSLVLFIGIYSANGLKFNLKTDTTIIAGQSGEAVVNTVVDLIAKTSIFPTGQLFLRRLAWVESTDGNDKKTYSPASYNGGIWQVDEDKFNDTKNLLRMLGDVSKKIKDEFGIEWKNVKWVDLRKPLYSGLAAVIYFQIFTGGAPIPSSITGQAKIWKSVYRVSGSVSDFQKKVGQIKKGCSQKSFLDVAIILDSSANFVNSFEEKRKLVSEIIKLFVIGPQKIQVGLIQFGAKVSKIVINSNVYHPESKLLNIIHNMNSLAGSLHPADSILTASNMLKPQKSGGAGGRRGSSRLIIFITDNKIKNSAQVAKAITLTRNNGIAIYAIGLGSRVDKNELDKLASNPIHTGASILSNSSQLADILPQLDHLLCVVPAILDCSNHTFYCGTEIHVRIPPMKYGGTVVINPKKQILMMYATNGTMISNPVFNNISKPIQSPVMIRAFPNQALSITVNSRFGCSHPFQIQVLESHFGYLCTPKNMLNKNIWFAHPTDRSKFILCTGVGVYIIGFCPQGESFNVVKKGCFKSNCQLPAWDDQNEQGKALPSNYPNLCPTNTSRRCEFIYLEYLNDRHQFIRCDRLGQASVKTCPVSHNWNTVLNNCTFEITTTPITTTRLQCPIPAWVNHSDPGKTLPSFYRNPCQANPTQMCKFIYMKYALDDNKFIQCDRSGQALLRTCPASFKWDNKLGQCSIPIATTTPWPQCLIPAWVKQGGPGTNLPSFYRNPCQANLTRKCKFIYLEYALEGNKFIQCDRSGQALLRTCPASFKWDNKLGQCSFNIITTTPRPQCPIPAWVNQRDPGKTLPSFYPNPCQANSIRKCEFIYMKYALDVNKFIQCDRSGQALVRTCPASFKWDSKLGQCSFKIITTTPQRQCPIPAWVNQRDPGTTLPSFYPNPCQANPTRKCEFIYMKYIIENNKFIQCDRLGQALVRTCPTYMKWDNKLVQCSITIIDITTTTPQPQCPIPAWVNQRDPGTTLPSFYPNPCQANPTRKCEFIYMKDIIENNKFIQCDRLGQALVRTCPTYMKWDNKLVQCSITINGITTTTPQRQCPIPAWVNQRDPGKPLPSFYPNPCQANPTRKCEFIYMKDIIEDNKFIQCDRLGQALVRTCPTYMKWDNKLVQCSITNIGITTTTPQPQCPIPAWVNQRDPGTPLPSFYPNPCQANPTRKCEFIYMKDIIEDNKFIQCDRLGQALVRTCPTYMKWDNKLVQCSIIGIMTTTPQPQCPIPAWVNQRDPGTTLPSFYPNPCQANPTRKCEFIYMKYIIEDNKFIQCDRLGQALVRTCPTYMKWDNKLVQCSITNIGITTTTPQPQCPIPAWVNRAEVGVPFPSSTFNPCRVDTNRWCDFLFVPLPSEPSKFLKCDRYGSAVIMSCPISWIWDNQLNQCSYHNPNPTPDPNCPFPSGVNSNQPDMVLPSNYLNPCLKKPGRKCQYTYLQHIIDNNKCIQCDRQGNAVVKTCLPSYIWNDSTKQCYYQTI